MRKKDATPLTRRFPFDATGGFYLDPATRHAICPKCLASGSVLHMMEQDGARYCHACHTACQAGTP